MDIHLADVPVAVFGCGDGHVVTKGNLGIDGIFFFKQSIYGDDHHSPKKVWLFTRMISDW